MNCLSITTKKEHSISFLKTIFLQQIFTVTFIIDFIMVWECHVFTLAI